ncbi:hypothetical protein D3C75_1085410 [compost metagenome]
MSDRLIILGQQITYTIQHGDGVICTVELPVFVNVILRVKCRRLIDDILVVHREVCWIHCIQHHLQFVCVQTVATTDCLVVQLHSVTYGVVNNDNECVDWLGSQLGQVTVQIGSRVIDTMNQSTDAIEDLEGVIIEERPHSRNQDSVGLTRYPN